MAKYKEAGASLTVRPETVTDRRAAPVLQTTAMNPALLTLAQARRVLLLQGPVGAFYDRLTEWLRQRGTSVERVVFHAGDLQDCRALTPVQFTGKPEAWPQFFRNLVGEMRADCVVLFGQSRSYHVAALEICKQRGLAVVVLEEGYVRPGYITMELGGVNGYSTTLQNFVWQPKANPTDVALLSPPTTEGQFSQMARYAIRHYLAMHLGSAQFPNYRHHKSTSLMEYSRYWVISWLRKYLHSTQDNRTVRQLANRPFYLVPLQHDGDSQIIHHSRFEENTEFIIEVLRSFAHHALADHLLVFKQHPFSRGGPGHGTFIATLAQELGIARRVLHLVEGHTPTLVKQSLGVVVINSTVGLQALFHKKPLLALGDALYHRPGVTFQHGLDRFWNELQPPQEPDLNHLLEQLLNLTQAPCNVYGLPNEPLLWHIEAPLTEGVEKA